MNRLRAVLWTSLIGFVAVLPVPGSAALAQDTAELGNFKPPREGGVRRWEVAGSGAQVFREPAKGSDLVTTLDAGVVLQNRGCSERAGVVWCEVRSLRGDVRGNIPASQLRPAKGPDGIVATGLDDSRQRADKRNFDADDVISCAQEQGQALGKCDAAVARGVGGDATVVVTFQNGFARKLYFLHGAFVKASATMSGVGTDMEWRLDKAIHHVRVDDQRFELPDRFVFGD